MEGIANSCASKSNLPSVNVVGEKHVVVFLLVVVKQ